MDNSMIINPHGYWEGDNLPHGVDPELCHGLIKFFYDEYKNHLSEDNSKIYIIDIGCGNGFYTNRLNEIDEFVVHGYDGNPDTPYLAGANCGVFDFTQDAKALGIHDWVLCLEVGEHIPEKYSNIFLDNLDYLADYGIVLSWSIPEYGGDGHVNPQPNQKIINEMEHRGFKFDKKDTEFLRDYATKYPNTGWWFKETLMVFRRVKDYRGMEKLWE